MHNSGSSEHSRQASPVYPAMQSGVLALIVLAMAIVFYVQLRSGEIQTAIEWGRRIDDAGRQRVRSQRIVKNLLLLDRQLEQATPADELTRELRLDLESFQKEHYLLRKQLHSQLSSARGKDQGTAELLMKLESSFRELTDLSRLYLQDPSSGEDLLKTLILAERDFLRYQDEFIGLISSELAYWAYSRDMQSLMYGMGAVCLIPLVVFLVNWHILRYLRRIYVRLLGRTQQLQRRTRDLWDSREQMRLLLENLPAAAYTCDSQGLITYYNQAAVGLWGRAPRLNNTTDRYCGAFRSFNREGQEYQRDDCWVAVALRDQCCVHGEEIVVETPQGHRRTVLTHASPLYNMNGDCTGIVTVLIDVSERMELERSLRATTAKLELCLRILDQHSIVAETDLSGVIRHVNDMFCRISGYSRGETLGKTHKLVNSGYHPPGFWKGVFGTIAREGMWQGAIRNRRKNGEPYWVEATIAKMFDGNGVPCGYFAIHNDITELKSAKEQALAACRSKSEFLANMSHEIRTPLTAILGYAELLRDDEEIANCPEKRQRALNTVHDAGKHLLAVINDILDLSKIEAGKMSVEAIPAPLTNILGQVESLLRPRALAKGIDFLTVLETPIPNLIQCDPTRLRQILMNLAGNAVKFTQQGKIRFVVRMHAEAAGNQLQIDIEDTGPGLTECQRANIFEAFSQADNSVTRQHGGTGLGLTISQRLARLLGGGVELLWTEPGRGTCFRITLPCRTLPETSFVDNIAIVQEEFPLVREASHRELEGKRILLAEDGLDNQRLISYLLRKMGATVDIADNGRIALERIDEEILRNGHHGYDFLLTDMQMPEMDGYSLAAKLRARGFKFPIIALTAHAMAEDRQKCLQAGCDDFLTKPIQMSVLANTLHKFVAADHTPHAASP